MISLGEALDLCRPDAGYREDYLVCLYHYAAALSGPSIIVEIGCFRGLSTLMLACGAPEGSHVFTIDPIFRTGTHTYPNTGNTTVALASNLDEVRAFWEKAGVNDRISVIPQYSWGVVEQWEHGAPSLIFIDGEHTFSAVVKDCRWLDLVCRNGLAVFDDWIDEVERGVMWALIERPEWEFLHKSTSPPEGEMVLTLLRKRW